MKSILNRLKYIDSWFWCRYTLNPYQGCEHACIYCDARSERYYLHEDFEDRIYIKENAVNLLNHKLKNSRTFLPDVVSIGGTCDAYQPAEAKYHNTRKILKILLKYNFPINISTKNVSIKEDLSIIQDIAKKTWATVAFTITTTDPTMADFLEPNASPPEERLKVIKLIAKNYPKIHVGVNFMPIVPFLEDTSKNLNSVFQKSKEAGAEFILFSPGMTLRDSQADFFLRHLKRYFVDIDKPEQYSRFLNLFNQRSSQEVNRKYFFEKTHEILEICKKFDIKTRVQRWYPSDFRNSNYKAAEKLFTLAYENQIIGKEYKGLFWAAMHIQNLTRSLGSLHASGDLEKLNYITPKIREIIGSYIKKHNTIEKYLKK
ncbi:MAG: radical SAM protein [Promethearchaeota archaeon]